MPVVLDLGTFGDAVPEPGEDVLQLTLYLRDEVEVPAGEAVATGGEIDLFAPGGSPRCGGGERVAADARPPR